MNLKKGIRLFFVLLVITITLLLAITTSRETFSALKSFQIKFLLLSFLLWFIYVLFDALRVHTIIHGVTGKFLPLSISFDINLMGSFLAAITPFQTGGFPIQIYLLHKNGVSVGKGTLIIFLRGVFFGLFFLTTLPFILPLFKLSNEFFTLFLYSLIVYSVVIILFIIFIIKPVWLKLALFKFAKIVKIRKIKEGILRLSDEFYDMREKFIIFARRKIFHTLIAYVFTDIAFLSCYSVAPLILKGLGINANFAHTFILQLFIVLITFFFPTPGSTGAAEGGFALLFATIAPKYILGIYSILWRFFTFYLSAIIGGILTLKVFHIGEKEIEGKINSQS
uniref:Flippase-like domain-containing protein n=1 Tax=candidate division WOR-3 bacterium TaxID=2052148 RepID=A0A7C4U880_UNCW3